MKTKLAILALAILCGASFAGAAVVVVDPLDRGYYLHGPGYYVGPRHYVWVPGHWNHAHTHWIHGHYKLI